MEWKRGQAILILGIAMRIFVFLFQDPFNNDYHFQVIKYIRETKTIPLATQMSQGYHPPLYYLLAQFFYLGDSSLLRLKGLQFFSLLTSLLTLIILFLMIKRFFRSPKVRLYSALLTALLPQFILFGNFVSNDSLSFLFGALIFFHGYLFFKKHRLFQLLLTALWLGLGLLTKGTFLAFIPILLLFVVVVQIRLKKKWPLTLAHTFIFILIFTVIGSYKYIQNYVHFGRPFIHNTDPLVQKATNWPWAKDQKGTYRGVISLIDWNIGKLVVYPTFSETTRHSYFLLLYGTLWYQYIHESNLEGNLTRFRYLGSILYILALVPTLLIFSGGIRFLKDAFVSLRKKEWNDEIILKAFSILIIISTLAMIIFIGIKTDVWSCFQARIAFPAIWGMIVLFASGLEVIETRKNIFAAVTLFLRLLFAGFILYFSIEFFILILK